MSGTSSAAIELSARSVVARVVVTFVAALLLGAACAHPYGFAAREDGLHADCATDSDCRMGRCFAWKERARPIKDRTTCEIRCNIEKHDCPGELTCDAPYPDGPPPFCH